MRGSDVMPENLFTAGKLDDHVPADHPLRFVGIPMEREIGNRSVFSKNRARLLEHKAVEALFTGVMTLADKRNLPSKERCPADGAPIQARAGPKSFRPKAVCGAASSVAMRRRRGWGAPETPRADGDSMPANRIRPRPGGRVAGVETWDEFQQPANHEWCIKKVGFEKALKGDA